MDLCTETGDIPCENQHIEASPETLETDKETDFDVDQTIINTSESEQVQLKPEIQSDNTDEPESVKQGNNEVELEEDIVGSVSNEINPIIGSESQGLQDDAKPSENTEQLHQEFSEPEKIILPSEEPTSIISIDSEKVENEILAEAETVDAVPERRMSLRLSAAHAKKEDSLPRGPSSLKSNHFIVKRIIENSYLASVTGKENSRPLFNKSISHIPTLKERVSSLASKPTATKRPGPVSTSNLAKKPKFDLKDSLKKPLKYKPYTGPVEKRFPF